MNICKISVIIATYNTADYLEECLDSIFGQTLKGIEVILVDDGSTDNTAMIIKKFKRKYNNLVSFYQENQGAGKARNFAIQFSQGKYVIFMDPDDKYPYEDCLEKLYLTAEKYNVLICGGNILSNDNGVMKNWYLAGTGDKYCTKNDIIETNDYFFLYGHTRYLFRTSLIKENKVEYADYCNYEDQVFTVKALGIAKKLYELDYPVYEYRVNHKQRNLDYDTFYDTLCGFRDTLRMIVKYNMRYMFEKNYWYFMEGNMSLIAEYVFCGNADFDKLIYEINSLVTESGWDCYEAHLITKQQIIQYNNIAMAEKEKLREIILEEKPIIIYGAGNNTKKLISDYGEQMHNVIGIAVSNLVENCLDCAGLPVRLIDCYIQYRDEAIVLITPSEKFKNEILIILKNLGFKRYEWIDVRMIK